MYEAKEHHLDGLHAMKIQNPMLSATKDHGLHLPHIRVDISLMVMTLRTEDMWIIHTSTGVGD